MQTNLQPSTGKTTIHCCFFPWVFRVAWSGVTTRSNFRSTQCSTIHATNVLSWKRAGRGSSEELFLVTWEGDLKGEQFLKEKGNTKLLSWCSTAAFHCIELVNGLRTGHCRYETASHTFWNSIANVLTVQQICADGLKERSAQSVEFTIDIHCSLNDVGPLACSSAGFLFARKNSQAEILFENSLTSMNGQ